MKIQQAPAQLPSFKALSSGSAGQKAANMGSKIAETIAQHPIMFTADAVNLGSGVANAMGNIQGPGGDVLKGTSFVMGGYHTVKAFTHLVRGVEAYDRYRPEAGKHHMTMLAGEILTATGQFCAGAGVGPVSLGFLGLGMVVTNAAELSQK